MDLRSTGDRLCDPWHKEELATAVPAPAIESFILNTKDLQMICRDQWGKLPSIETARFCGFHEK
jgi:hypothetical protein